MEHIRLPNQATYLPIGLLDISLAAPLLSRLFLRASYPGMVLQAAALGLYVSSVVQDWVERRGLRRIDFQAEFGAGVEPGSRRASPDRLGEARALAGILNRRFTSDRIPRRELVVRIDHHLTAYIAGITGQWVETSTEVRGFSVVGLLFPSALGACDVLSGDVAILRDAGAFEPHVIAHELCHRKGYWKELEAQALAYLALASSGDRVLVQSALLERLYRNLVVLACSDPEGARRDAWRVPDDAGRRFEALVAGSGLRSELRAELLALRPTPTPLEQRMELVVRRLYDERMRITGQNGLADYDEGFTDFLYTFETGDGARRSVPEAGRVWSRPKGGDSPTTPRTVAD